MPKRVTKKELLDLNAQLRAELSAVTVRDVEVYRILGGRFGGETPEDCAKRVVAERSTLADKVLKFQQENGLARHNEMQLTQQVGVLAGRLAAIRAISES